MTRERFKELQLEAIKALRAEMEEHIKNPMVLDSMRDGMEHKYKDLLSRQTAWESGGFWTPENEKRFDELYKAMDA